MASSMCIASIPPFVNNNPKHRNLNTPLSATTNLKTIRIRCAGDDPTGATTTTTNSTSTAKDKQDSSEQENVLLKLAWYGSELLGIAASVFRSPPSSSSAASLAGELNIAANAFGAIDREVVLDTIKEDFQRSYFVTGNLTLGVYEDDCEFADPAGSFKGLARFKRNCTNFGLLIEKSNMKLLKWEDYEDKGIGHWRFSCIMSFPWKPILSATGYTEYYFDAESRRVCRHIEHWNVPKMALLKQLMRPSRGFWRRRDSSSDS